MKIAKQTPRMGERAFRWSDELVRVKSRRTLAWIEPLRPSWGHGNLYPWGVQETFEVLQWLARLGQLNLGLVELLSCDSCNAIRQRGYIGGFSGKEWRADLQRRFQYLLFSDRYYPMTKEFKARWNIGVYEKIVLPMTIYYPTPMCSISSEYPDTRLDDQLARILSTYRNWRTKEQLNPCHKGANSCRQVVLFVWHWGFEVRMYYAYPKAFSSWNVSIRSRSEEMFFDFIQRAEYELLSLLRPSTPDELAQETALENSDLYCATHL